MASLNSIFTAYSVSLCLCVYGLAVLQLSEVSVCSLQWYLPCCKCGAPICKCFPVLYFAVLLAVATMQWKGPVPSPGGFPALPPHHQLNTQMSKKEDSRKQIFQWTNLDQGSQILLRVWCHNSKSRNPDNVNMGSDSQKYGCTRWLYPRSWFYPGSYWLYPS